MGYRIGLENDFQTGSTFCMFAKFIFQSEQRWTCLFTRFPVPRTVLGAESVLVIVVSCRSNLSFKLIEVILLSFGYLAPSTRKVKCVWHIRKTVLLMEKCRKQEIFNKGVRMIWKSDGILLKHLAGWCNLDVFILCDTFGPFDPNSCEYVLTCLYKDVKIHVDVWRKPPQYCN